MKEFNKNNIGKVRDIIQSKLDEAAKELGVSKIELGNIRYNFDIVTSSIEASIHTDAENPKIISFLEANNLPTDLIGKAINPPGGRTFIVRTIDFKKIKYPIIVEGTQGGQYKLSVDQVKSGLVKPVS